MKTAAEERARADTQTQAEGNRSGGGGGCLLSEFFVQLIFVCEAGGGHDCSHDERGRASRFSGRLAQVPAELVKVEEEEKKKREARAERGELRCSNKDPL